MALTPEQIREIQSKLGIGTSSISVPVQAAPVAQSASVTPTIDPRQQFTSDRLGLSGIGSGVGKASLGTVRGLGILGERGIRTILGTQSSKPTFAERVIPQSMITPETKAEKSGFVAGEVAQFLLPGGVAGKAPKAAVGASRVGRFLSGAKNVATRAAREGAETGVIAAAQEQGDIKAGAQTGAIAAAIPVVGAIGSIPAKLVKDVLPRRLVQGCIKAIKSRT